MPANQAELRVGELAGLVQDRIGHRHLADVVQQSGQPRLAYQRVGQFELAGEGDHQRTDRHRMHVGVFIRGLQPYQAEQRVGMAQHRGGDFVHQLRCMRGIDGLAHARVAEHADHGGLGTAAEQGGVADFLLQGDPRRRRAGRHGDRQDRSGRDRRFLREVEALAGIDPDFLHGAFAQALQVGLAVEQEATSFQNGGPATSRKGSGRTYRGEAGLPECVSARWARPRDWARWLSPNGSRDGPAGVRDARHFVGMPALDCVSLCIHARFRYLRRTNPRVGRYTPIHLPGEMATSEPRRPGRPQKVPPPGSYRRHQRARLRPGRLLWRRSMSVFDSRQKTSASLLGAVLVGNAARRFGVRRRAAGPGLQVAAASAGEGKCGEGKCGSGGSAKTRPRPAPRASAGRASAATPPLPEPTPITMARSRAPSSSRWPRTVPVSSTASIATMTASFPKPRPTNTCARPTRPTASRCPPGCSASWSKAGTEPFTPWRRLSFPWESGGVAVSGAIP